MDCPPPGWATSYLACEPAAHNPPCCAASSTSSRPACGQWRLSPPLPHDGTSNVDTCVSVAGPGVLPCARLPPTTNAASGFLASRSSPDARPPPNLSPAGSVPDNSPPAYLRP